MKKIDVMDFVIRTMATWDPVRFGAVPDAAPTDPVPPTAAAVRATVREALSSQTKDATQAEQVTAAWRALKREASLIDGLADLLWQTHIRTLPAQVPSLPGNLSSAKVQKLMDRYVQSLKALGDLLEPVSLNPRLLPPTRSTPAELLYLPPVFRFLAARRSRLRNLVHGEESIGDPSAFPARAADRADEILAMYNTLLIGADLAETPENWSLRSIHETLQNTMVDLLVDLLHLVDAEGLDWDGIVARAKGCHDDEIEEED